MIITLAFNLFLVPGEVIWEFGFLKLTYEGIRQAVKIGIRLIYLVIGSSVMTLTTTPNQLTDGLERILNPLKKIKVPVHEISMMMSIALRFIPILMEETDKIMKAQIARGADFESGNLIQKAKSLIPLLVPLFISAFRRADDLAMAMEARCYHGGENRTQMKPLIYKAAKSLIPLLVPLFISAFRRADDLAMAMEARCYHGGENRTQMKPLIYKARDYWAYAVCLFYLGADIAIRILL